MGSGAVGGSGDGLQRHCRGVPRRSAPDWHDFASFFIQHITFGGAYVDRAIYSSQISDLISAVIIYMCGFVLFFRQVMTRLAERKAEENLRKEANLK